MNGFSGSVTLGCQVTTTVQNPTDPPQCSVSPETVSPPASASATITTKSDTSTVSYAVVITGTPSSGPAITLPEMNLTVLAVSPQFTITVERPVAPSSVPAGNGGEGIINISPVNGYTTTSGGITLSCSSITPLVTLPPVCSFNPPVVTITGPGTYSSQITISTFGNVTTTAAVHPRRSNSLLYGLWMPLPMLAIIGLGAVSNKRSRKAWGLLALFVMCGTLFLILGCSNAANRTTAPNGITPAGTYSFTVTGVDGAGNIASNTGSTTSANPSVSLTVTAPTP